jgi:hypothetical protein
MNISRMLVGGRRMNQYDLPSANITPPTIFLAVAIDVIYDPKLLTVDEKNELRQIVSNPEFIETMPSNTIIGKIISNQQNQTDSSVTIIYPFFQSHIMLPIQAGEQIMVIYEDYSYGGTRLGRWITRNSENYMVEDPNFTHGDRRFDPDNNPNQRDVAEQRNQSNNQTTPPKPSFPNGSGTPESFTLQPSKEEPNINPFEIIFRNANATKLHMFEPVPRWTKRPQEFIIQSMNNSLIMLGQDRIGPATRAENSNEKLKYSGTIDLVAGRGRIPLETNENTASEEKSTSVLTTLNTRNKVESDKTPFLRNRSSNAQEGNPNFKTDAARIYVSMNTSGDTNFKLLHGSNGIDYPENTIRPEQQPSGPNENVGSAYVVEKADHIRHIARKSTTPEINGTFLIIKEGIKNQDLAYFYINESGKMQIEAPEIYLSKATEKKEPYIKWSKFKETVDKLHEEIDIVKNKLEELVQQLLTAAPTSMCSPFSPDPAWTSLTPQLAQIRPNLESLLSSKKQETNRAVDDSKSSVIFGF